MTTVSLPLPFAPAFDPALLATLRRRAMMAVRAAALLGGSTLMAMGLWLILAGPGFLHDGPSTVPARMVARR